MEGTLGTPPQAKRRPLLSSTPPIGVSSLVGEVAPLSLYRPSSFPPFRHKFFRRSVSRRLILILLLRSGVHPNPGPPHVPPHSILQWNCNGLHGAAEALNDYLSTKQVKIACLQETKLRSSSRDPKFPGYSILRRDRPGDRMGGGLAFLIHHSIAYTPINTSFANSDPHLELQGINVVINNVALSVFNVYCPPSSSCTPRYRPDISNIVANSPRDCLIVGDWNAHSGAWCSAWDDERGEHLADAIDNSDLCVLNQDCHTRLPRGDNQRPSSPDISLISAHLVVEVDWSVSTELSSDHLDPKPSTASPS